MRPPPGFQQLHQGVDRTAGRAAAVSTWDTAEQAQFSRDALVGFAFLRRRFLLAG